MRPQEKAWVVAGQLVETEGGLSQPLTLCTGTEGAVNYLALLSSETMPLS